MRQDFVKMSQGKELTPRCNKYSEPTSQGENGGTNMNPTLSSAGNRHGTAEGAGPVKLTALIYLREALIAERYED